MEKYVKADNFGKDFITHADQETDELFFDCIGDLNKVNGDEEKINAWAERVGGIIITEEDYLLQKTTLEKISIENQIASLESEKSVLTVELADKVEILNISTL